MRIAACHRKELVQAERPAFAGAEQPQTLRRIQRLAGVLYPVVHPHYFGEYLFRQVFVGLSVGKAHQHAFSSFVYVYIAYQVEGGFAEHHVALLYQRRNGVPVFGNPGHFQRSACRQAVFPQVVFQFQ